MPLVLPHTGRVADLPVQILDPDSLTMADEEMLAAMAEYVPNTKFKPGDLAYLTEAPPYLRSMRRLLPRVWQVRFIISKWAHELMQLSHAYSVRGVDHAIALLDKQHFDPNKYDQPVLYVHGYPHGLYPDSAAWVPERILRRVTLREQNQAWNTILDEAKAPFVGYDCHHLAAPYIFDQAPDMYSNGENLGKPFSFEEATTHTAALLGMEEVLFKPVDPFQINSKRAIDPEHDIFKKR